MDNILGWEKYVEKEEEKAKTIIDFKANDICCHCGKDLSTRESRPDGYYYLSAALIGSVKSNDFSYRLCTDCFKPLKEVIGSYFKTEGDN